MNPKDGKITPYYAPNNREQYVYKDLLSLLEKHERSLLNKYIESQKKGLIPFLSQCWLEDNDDNREVPINYPIINKGTDIYKQSKAMKLIQYMDKNIIRVWNDEILTRSDYPLLEMLFENNGNE